MWLNPIKYDDMWLNCVHYASMGSNVFPVCFPYRGTYPANNSIRWFNFTNGIEYKEFFSGKMAQYTTAVTIAPDTTTLKNFVGWWWWWWWWSSVTRYLSLSSRGLLKFLSKHSVSCCVGRRADSSSRLCFSGQFKVTWRAGWVEAWRRGPCSQRHFAVHLQTQGSTGVNRQSRQLICSHHFKVSSFIIYIVQALFYHLGQELQELENHFARHTNHPISSASINL